MNPTHKLIRIVFLIVALSVFLPACNGGGFTIPEWVVKSCAFVMNGEDAFGTGFIIGVQETNKVFYYFITAKHVVAPIVKCPGTLRLRLNLKHEERAEVVPFPVLGIAGKAWIEHENPAIDLVAMPLAIGGQEEFYDFGLFVVDSPTNEYFACQTFLDSYKVGPGDKAFSLGLVPHTFNKSNKSMVLSRSGSVSALGKAPIDLPGGKQRTHFLDCPAYGGSSGGPAFVLLERNEKAEMIAGWRFALLGVVTEFVPSPLRSAEVTIAEKERQKATILLENTGISKVVPVDYLADLLFSKDQVAWRKEYLAEQNRPRQKWELLPIPRLEQPVPSPVLPPGATIQ